MRRPCRKATVCDRTGRVRKTSRQITHHVSNCSILLAMRIVLTAKMLMVRLVWEALSKYKKVLLLTAVGSTLIVILGLKPNLVLDGLHNSFRILTRGMGQHQFRPAKQPVDLRIDQTLWTHVAFADYLIASPHRATFGVDGLLSPHVTIEETSYPPFNSELLEVGSQFLDEPSSPYPDLIDLRWPCDEHVRTPQASGLTTHKSWIHLTYAYQSY